MSAATAYDIAARRSAAAVIGEYSTSFGWACHLLGPSVRDDIRSVYALVRLADEIVDDLATPLSAGERGAALDALEAEVGAATARGYSTNLVVHAYAGVARRYAIGADLIDPFFASMRSDLTPVVHDAQSVTEYVHGSAEVVGLACLRVFVGGDDAAYRRLAPGAARLGAAFQTVNFLRDLAEDTAAGRHYLPDWEDSPTTAGRDAVVDRVDADLAAAEAQVDQLPANSRLAVRLAHGLFAELSRRLRRTPPDVLTRHRVRVPGPVKARVLGAAILREGRR